MRKALAAVAGLAVTGLVLTGCSGGGGDAGGSDDDSQVEVFTWWAAGSEKAGLDALVDVFNQQYPDTEFVNAAVAGGAGSNAKNALASRLKANNPPDSFQAHAGAELATITSIVGHDGFLTEVDQVAALLREVVAGSPTVDTDRRSGTGHADAV